MAGWATGPLRAGTCQCKSHGLCALWCLVSAISMGHWHSAALCSNGSLWMWGGNFYGQLCDAATTDRHSPVNITLSVCHTVSATSMSDGFYILRHYALMGLYGHGKTIGLAG